MKPELLSPAGDKACLRAAVNQGCDAVYLGGTRFNARNAAANFTDRELVEAIDYCHERGVLVYVTVNTLYDNEALPEALRFAAAMLAEGADALIVQDMGFAARIKAAYPDCVLHASTQMTARSTEDVLFLRQAGFKRVVLARELDIESVAAINHRVPDMETEVFVHGAICFCYSGQCLMSAFLGGRSGNQGACAQPCRLPYTLSRDKHGQVLRSGHLLSPKDMNTLAILPDIVRTGVSGLKIEGRMKSPEYVALVTRAYRRRLDGLPVAEEEARALLQIFNRGGGFSTGYYRNAPTSDAMSTESPKNTGVPVGTVLHYNAANRRCTVKADTALVPGDGLVFRTAPNAPEVGVSVNKPVGEGETGVFTLKRPVARGATVYRNYDKRLQEAARTLYANDTRKQPISAALRLRAGEASVLTLICGGVSATAEGDASEPAKSAPITIESLRAGLDRFGNTPFVLQTVTADLGENLFLPPQTLNQLRRDACERLRQAIIGRHKRPVRDTDAPPDDLAAQSRKAPFCRVAVQVRHKAQLTDTLAETQQARVYMEAADWLTEIDALAAACHEKGALLFAALPRAGDSWLSWLDKLENSAIDGYLLRTMGQVLLCKDTAKWKALDTTFNIYNAAALAFYKPCADYFTLSPELTVEAAEKWADATCEQIGYGRLPLMVTRMCPVGLYGRCKAERGRLWLTDRKNAVYPIETDCDACVATIYSHRPVERPSAKRGTTRLVFTDEQRIDRRIERL